MTYVISGRPNILRWLPALACGLVLVVNLTPLPKVLDLILLVISGVLLLTCIGVALREEHRKREADQSNGAAISSGDEI